MKNYILSLRNPPRSFCCWLLISCIWGRGDASYDLNAFKFLENCSTICSARPWKEHTSCGVGGCFVGVSEVQSADRQCSSGHRNWLPARHCQFLREWCWSLQPSLYQTLGRSASFCSCILVIFCVCGWLILSILACLKKSLFCLHGWEIFAGHRILGWWSFFLSECQIFVSFFCNPDKLLGSTLSLQHLAFNLC